MAEKLDSPRHGDIRNALAQSEFTCKECGKLFYVNAGMSWVYKIVLSYKTMWFCSYKCWRNNGGAGGNEEYERRCLKSGVKKRTENAKVIGRGRQK